MNDPRIMLDDIKKEVETNLLAIIHHEKTSAEIAIELTKILGMIDELQNHLCEEWGGGEIAARLKEGQ